MSELIIYPPGTKLNNLQRRKLARAEMSHYPKIDIYRYLLVTNHVRHYRSGEMVYHSVIDALNIVDDFENEPRKFWSDMKRRLARGNKQLSEKIGQVKLPSWDDHKLYKADVIDTGWMFWLIAESKSPLAQEFKAAFADELNRNPQLEHDRLALQLDKEIGWTGSGIALQMQSIYEDGDYDETDWRQK